MSVKMSLVRGNTADFANTQYETLTSSSVSFDTLPLELVEIITLLIDMSTLCSLRATSGFGARIDWKRLENGALDMNQSAVRDWVNALRCLVNCRTVRTGRGRVRNLSIRWGPERSNLRDYEALAIAMLFIKIFPAPSQNRRPRSPPWAHLQSLTLTNILHFDHGGRFKSLLASTRALKSLTLAGVPDDFSFKVLSSRANHFPLERLEISGMHRAPIQMPTFLSALRKHRRTLKKQTLSDSTLHDDARWSDVFQTLRQGGFSALREFSLERLFEGSDHLSVSYTPGTLLVEAHPGVVLSWTLHHPGQHRFNSSNTAGVLSDHRVYYGAIGYLGPGVWRLFRRLEERAVLRDPREYSPSVPVVHKF